jgi:uncharacterized damage-inducible protein DinB
MPKAAIQELLGHMDLAFSGNTEPPFTRNSGHSLMENLRNVTAEEWLWLPPHGDRSIQQILGHCGHTKWIYESHAFGDGQVTWLDEMIQRLDASQGKSSPGMDEVVEWVRQGHERLRRSIASLGDDEELSRPRKLSWGEMVETRWIVMHMIEHDLYHAGEINHLRSLAQADDRWAFRR